MKCSLICFALNHQPAAILLFELHLPRELLVLFALTVLELHPDRYSGVGFGGTYVDSIDIEIDAEIPGRLEKLFPSILLLLRTCSAIEPYEEDPAVASV